jgi:hypothetical protein
VKKLTITIVLLAAAAAPVQAAPSLQDCERIFSLAAKQHKIAQQLVAQVNGVTDPAALCRIGKTAGLPAIARDIAQQRALRTNRCWAPSDEARLQRIIQIHASLTQSVAALCVAARNPGVVPTRAPSRSLTRD